MTYINKVLALKILILIFFILSLSFFSYLNYSLNKKIYNNSKNRKIFLINEGDSITKSINTLKKKNIISSDFRSKIIIYMHALNPKFNNGKYAVNKSDTEYSFLLKLVNGNVLQDKVTILEGSTYKDIIRLLRNSNLLKDEGRYINKIYPSEINYLSPEGMCFPDTYKFSSGISIDYFLKNCAKKMNSTLIKYWNNRDYSLPYKSPYEMLIMASIIEKETSLPSEKAIVASVFVNRLNKKMRLQADPTVIYGMKNFDGNITKKDLRENNEYNTYRIKGLPKTPICSPGEESIQAASRPNKTEYLYFVANKKGKHIFSKNYKDHVKAVNKYQK